VSCTGRDEDRAAAAATAAAPAGWAITLGITGRAALSLVRSTTGDCAFGGSSLTRGGPATDAVDGAEEDGNRGAAVATGTGLGGAGAAVVGAWPFNMAFAFLSPVPLEGALLLLPLDVSSSRPSNGD